MSSIDADENAKSRQLESHLNQKRTRRRVDRTAAMVRIGAPLWSSGHDIAKSTSFKSGFGVYRQLIQRIG